MVRPATETRTPRARQTVTPSSASSSSDDDRWAWLTRVAFVLALGLVICRATVNEILREPFPVAPLKSGEVAPPRAPGPTTSLVLDLASCLPALLVLARRLIDKTYVLRWSWSIVPLIALAAWALLSTAWSADRFLAAIAACQLLAAGALLWATTQLVRSWLRLRVVAAVCFGLLLVYTANGILFRWIDVPQMREYWQKNRAEVLKSRGWDEGDFMARQFERKVTSGEMIGFNVSPNSLAATVVLLVVVSAGVMLQRFSDRDPPGWGLLMIPGIAAGFWLIYYTGSRTAFATPLLAAGAFAGLRILRGWLSRRAALAYWLGLGAVLVVMLALVGHGLYHGSLLHDSLTFRWKYWVGSWDVFTAHPIAGVGWANFGYHYLGERLPEASEEIKDPHNLFVRAFVELGLMGGVLIIAWLTRTWWELTRPIAPAPSGAGAAKLVNTARPYSGLPLVATVSTVGIALSVLATVDWSVPMENLVIESFKRLLFLCAMVLGMTLVVLRSTDKQELDERPAPWVLYGILIGLGVFLVHNLIDFSLFEPGPMTLFAALAGAALGVRQPSHAGERKRTPLVIGATVLACAAWLGILIFLLVPVAEAEARAHAADDALRANHPGQAAGGFQAAYGAVLFNADYAFRVAQALSYHRAGPEQIRPWLARALETNPFAPEYYLTRARYELNLQPVDQQTVRADFESALRLNPNAVDIRLEYADILARFGPKQEAVAQYEKSMEYNRLLDPNEPKRLTSKKIEEVERAIAELK